MTILKVESESWLLATPFVIARGSKTHADVVLVTITQGAFTGRGECVPYKRYGETLETVLEEIEAVRETIENGINRQQLQKLLPAGAARNAVDCAFWDMECQEAGISIWQRLGQKTPRFMPSVQTICLGSADSLQQRAAFLKQYPVLKLKLDADSIVERVSAVHAGAPDSKLIIDANESWSLDLLQETAPALARMNVVMIEQPLPTGEDHLLKNYDGSVPLGADESCHTVDDLPHLKGLYQFVNIKLDKAGGLTAALLLYEEARRQGYGVMVGSMVSTSLALAPALPLALQADFVDLDSPNLLAEDREGGFLLEKGVLSRFEDGLWGNPLSEM